MSEKNPIWSFSQDWQWYPNKPIITSSSLCFTLHVNLKLSEKSSSCMCVCVWEIKRKSVCVRESVCVWERKREGVCVCVCIREGEIWASLGIVEEHFTVNTIADNFVLSLKSYFLNDLTNFGVWQSFIEQFIFLKRSLVVNNRYNPFL